MAEIVLRVRLIGGDHVDVSYGDRDAVEDEVMEYVISTLAEDCSVMEENVLGKQTVSGREWAFRQLRRFYALNPQSLLFRALRELWEHGRADQPLLALLCALARDPVLRAIKIRKEDRSKRA